MTSVSPEAQQFRWLSPAVTIDKFVTCFSQPDSPGCAGSGHYPQRANALINCCSFSCCDLFSSAGESCVHSGSRGVKRCLKASLLKEYSYQLSSYQLSSHYYTRHSHSLSNVWSCCRSWRTWRASWATAPSSCSGTTGSLCSSARSHSLCFSSTAVTVSSRLSGGSSMGHPGTRCLRSLHRLSCCCSDCRFFSQTFSQETS